MPFGRKRPQDIDPELAFQLWYELGTAQKAAQELARRGVVNSYTGKPVTHSGVTSAAHRYMLYSPDEAREYYLKEKVALAMDDVLWGEYLVEKAMTYLLRQSSRTRFEDWVKDYGMEKFDYMWAKKLGVEAKYERPER